MEPFTGAEAATERADRRSHRKQEGVLGEELKDVSGGVDLKTGRAARPDAAIRLRLHQFSQQISGMNHDELLGLVLDQFAADKEASAGTRSRSVTSSFIISPALRYASASRTWGPPQELLATLKEQEIREMFAVADRGVVEQRRNRPARRSRAELASKDTRRSSHGPAEGGQDGPGCTRSRAARLAATRPKEAARP